MRQKNLNMKIVFLCLIVFIANNINGQIIYPDQGYKNTWLIGTIRNISNDDYQNNMVEVSVNDWTTGISNTYYTQIDSSGNFLISFFVLNSQDVLFSYNDKWHTIFVRPNDTLKIFIDNYNFPLGNDYSGSMASACKDYTRFEGLTGGSFNQPELTMWKFNNKLSTIEYTIWLDSVYNAKLNTVEDYFNSCKTDSFFINWLKNDLYLRTQNKLLNYYFRNAKLIDFDPSFLNSIPIDTTFRFNSAYGQLINHISALLVINSNKDCNFFNELTIAKISPKIENNTVTPKPRFSDEELQKKLFNCFVNSTNLLNNGVLAQSVIAHRYFSILEQQNVDVGIENVTNNICDGRIQTSAILQHNYYQNRQNFLNPLYAGNAVISILDKLTTFHKGSIIFLMFWGTYWPPSINNINQIMDHFSEMKNENIIFISLCCRCQNDQWNSIINNFEGEHYLLNSSEYYYFAKAFNIISLPRFIVIDKAGNISNFEAIEVENRALVDKIKKFTDN